MAMSQSNQTAATSRDGSPMLKSQRDNLGEPTDRMILDLPNREHIDGQEEKRMEGGSRGLRPPEESTPRRLSPHTLSRQRPASMGLCSPPRSPPAVTVNSPKSPPRERTVSAFQSTTQHNVNSHGSPSAVGSRSPSHLSDHRFKTHSKPSSPVVDPRKSPFLSASEAMELPEAFQTLSEDSPHHFRSRPTRPPVNRAEKPANFRKQGFHLHQRSPSALAPIPSPSEDKISPFSTPPSSDESPESRDLPPPAHFKTPSKVFPPPKHISSGQKNFEPPPVHPLVVSKRSKQISRPGAMAPESAHPKWNGELPGHRKSDSPEHPPGLPRRREPAGVEPNPVNSRTPSKREAPQGQASKRPSPIAMSVANATTQYLPPPKRTNTAEAPRAEESGLQSRAQPPRPEFNTKERPPQTKPLQAGSEKDIYPEPPKGSISAADGKPQGLTDYPDSSQANRRQPCFKKGARDIPIKDARLFSICGEYICSSGQLTRAWDLVTGDMIMSLLHGETIKVTSISFKPATNLEEEGSRVWLGTNFGEIQEVDIPSQTIVFSKASAHPRREVIKILRHESEMWTLDDEGKLHVWPPDETGSPNLRYSHHSFRVPKGHSFSLIAGDHLWIATGKDIRVFQPSTDPSVQFQVLARPLNQAGVGEVTSGALIGSRADRVYFGHNDGKVTIYSRLDYACLGVVNVSLYKINSLAGVGDYLWAGFNTGMIYVYDTQSTPWIVKKDWQAHESPVLTISVDRTSIWKLDRLQVASLGADNFIRVWDGMLQEDWLETDLQRHDVEYCQFREIKALVTTWNAGASIPQSLKRDTTDGDFFRELMRSSESPDIMVFGFQELVDLEDKKVTAKSLFKSSKKKDPTEQEHMSRQYRAWRDHLTRCIEDYMPADEPYHLLHTANLVGLFTCVFVKDSQRKKVRQVAASEVKRGMGGLHGNKGALIVRFVLDDSSFCFVNCHLAAGQTQTTHRNNDIAGILETIALPGERDPSQRMDTFIGGGDGSMILDHEICILNGDLNYRIDTMNRDSVINAVRANNLSKLLGRDQLLLSRKRNPGFRLRAFHEGPITFAPTYKYDVGTDKYDTSDKKRAPAWCDRVLYRGLGRIKLLDYRRHEVRVSDHRPVSASFKIRIKTISPKKRALVWERCERDFERVKRQVGVEAKLDFLVNECGFQEAESRRLLDQSEASNQRSPALSERDRLSEIVRILQGRN
ncbi:MAG: hypothetical protein M1837_004194 [Sclerophora amabilis]|nr:MAG: hypothetical protein M1837_004194 [Sclerophora amabilis]